MELDRVGKPLRRLRKLLKDLPPNPPPEEVHKLRTQTRRIEAVANALEPAAQKQARRLLKVLKPVRKAAGSVRDMDVLTSDLLAMKQPSNSDSLLRLVEHLTAERSKNADRLLDTVDLQRKPARRRLKDYAETINSVAVGKKPVRRAVATTLESEDGSGSSADALLADLTNWPKLSARNLHDFRLKVKELRYVLQMFPNSDARFIDALGAAKDQIGQWHDWQQLHAIAHEVLDSREDRELLEQIENAGKQKLTRALVTSNSLRRRFLPTERRSRTAS